MSSTFKTTMITLVRTPAVIIWCLVFPIVLTGMFMVMFSSLSSDGTIDPVKVAVVDGESWNESQFSDIVDALDDPGDDQLLEVTFVKDEEAGKKLIEEQTVSGMFTLDDDLMPVVTVAPDNYAGTASMNSLHSSILERIADGYVQNYELITSAINENPALMSDPDALQSALDLSVTAEKFSPTRSIPDETVRYYYVLLAMVVLLAGTQTSSGAICQLQANITALGARRSIAGTSHARQLLGIILACWLMTAICTLATFAFIRLVVGVDFGGREPLCLLGLVGASLCSTALGAFVASLPLKGGIDMRSGLLIAVTMGLCMLAGLFGTFSMEMSDAMAAAWPPSAWINPPRLIADMFYSLYYYDSLQLYTLRLLACVVLAAIMFAASMIFFRRHRYEHL